MKTYGIVICGQSNEEGPAAYYAAGQLAKFNGVYGRAANDLVVDGTKSPSHWRGTAWTLLAQKLATNRGIDVIWRNAAIGGTGSFDAWAGGITTWESGNANGGFGVSAGSWVLPTVPNGFKYYTNSGGNAHATTEPTWPTVIDATVVDGTITWTCKAADDNDFPNKAYSRGQSGFDPKGYIAQAKNYMTDLMTRYPDLDEYIFILGGNQADLSGRYKTALMRFAAVTNIVQDFRQSFPKAHVGIALTCYWNTGFETGSRPRSYDAVLYPSYKMALNKFKDDDKVFDAGDWFTGLGKSITYVRGDTDAIHMSPETTLKAANVSYNAWVSSGKFER